MADWTPASRGVATTYARTYAPTEILLVFYNEISRFDRVPFSCDLMMSFMKSRMKPVRELKT